MAKKKETEKKADKNKTVIYPGDRTNKIKTQPAKEKTKE